MVVMNSRWTYDNNRSIGIFYDKDGNKHEVFHLKHTVMEPVESRFPVDRKKAAHRYEVEMLDENFEVPIGIVRRAIEIEDIEQKEGYDNYISRLMREQEE